MIQPLELNSLFDILDNKKIKVKSADFLFELLKNIDDKNLIKNLILKSNLNEKDKEFLLKKFNIKQSNSKNIIELIDDKVKIPNNLPKKLNFNHLDSKKIKIVSILDKLIDKDNKPKLKEIKNIPFNLQIEVVKEIKNILISKAKSDNVIKQFVSTKEFKEVKDLKDLLVLSKKFNLNLKKIVIKQIKPEIDNKNLNLANLNVVNKIAINKKINKNIKSKKDNKNLDLSSLINKKTLKPQHKRFAKSKEVSLNKLISKHKTSDIKIDALIKDESNSKNIDKLKTHHMQKNENEFVSVNDVKTEFLHKIINSKESIKHFVSSLKEAVENYKPPFTKLSLELHPKELGKVEVVIKQQGDNLNIQVNTQNQTTINFLTSQQQELKNSLVNMGFTNINMNFNFNDQKREKNQQHQYQTKKNINEEDELVIDFTYKYA